MNSKDDSKPATAPAENSQAKPSPLSPWEAIEVGAVVLWRVDRNEGWFETVVMAISTDSKILTLRWRDFKNLPTVQAKKLAVGLICKVD